MATLISEKKRSRFEVVLCELKIAHQDLRIALTDRYSSFIGRDHYCRGHRITKQIFKAE